MAFAQTLLCFFVCVLVLDADGGAPTVSCFAHVAAALTTLMYLNPSSANPIHRHKSGLAIIPGETAGAAGAAALREARLFLWTDFDKRIRSIPRRPKREACSTFYYFEVFC